MFNPEATVESLNAFSRNTLNAQLGIEFTEIGERHLSARMPVDHRTQQPFGLLHGGASVALAETLGSQAAALTLDLDLQFPVGLEINANHIKSVKDGFVEGTAKPIHVGRKTQVWEIKIANQAGDLVCISRITLAIIDKR